MKAAVAKTMDGHALNDDPAPGWYRELVARRSGDKVDAYYYPPDGTQLRSRPDVRRYFEAHPDEAKVGDRTSRRPAVLSMRLGSIRRGRVRDHDAPRRHVGPPERLPVRLLESAFL